MTKTLNAGSHLILLMLYDGPKSGYDILKAVDGLGDFLTPAMSQGQIYLELPRLETAGYVTSERVEQPPLPAKSVYTLADAGKSVLAHWLGDQRPLSPTWRHLDLIRLKYAWYLRDLKPVVRRLQARCMQLGKAFQEANARAINPGLVVDTPHLFFHHLAARHRLMQLDTELRITQETLQALQIVSKQEKAPTEEEEPA